MKRPANKTLITTTASAVLMMSIASASFAGCKRPPVPEFPDVELASHDEIKQASVDVNEYLKKTDSYLRCEKSGSRQTVAQRKMRKVVKQYNTMIEDYKVILAEYNKSNKTAIVTASVTP